MSVNPSSDPNTEIEYHNPVPSGLKNMKGLLRRLQMTHMDNALSTHWNESMPEKDDKSDRQNLYTQFALVSMLIQNQTAETRIQFIDLAYLFNPVYHPRISVEQIVKIFIKWDNLKSKANELQKNRKFQAHVYKLLVLMEHYERYHEEVFMTIPTYYHFDPIDSEFSNFEIISPTSLTGNISMPVSLDKSLRIRNTCLELAMQLKDPYEIRVKFLDLAYYFEPIFRKTSLEKYSQNAINSYILDQWKIILTLIDRVNREPKNIISTKQMLHVLQYQMQSYTDTLSQSQSYKAHTYAQTVQNTHNSRTYHANMNYPKRGYAGWPANNTQNTTKNRTYPRVIPYNHWVTRNEIVSQEPASHLTAPADQVRPCRCRGCTGCDGKPGHCRCIGRCRCVHDAADESTV
jgi:hypothetical protein